jgi:hypothetical protein
MAAASSETLPTLQPAMATEKTGTIHQADHLITRANSATYADTRLIVCACKGHHGWKKWHQKEYEALVRTLISPSAWRCGSAVRKIAGGRCEQAFTIGRWRSLL